MQYIKFTYVDSVTGLSVYKTPAVNDTRFPLIENLTFDWARETSYPTQTPEFFGTCPDESSIEFEGVLSSYSKEDWEQMKAIEIAARPNQEILRIDALWKAANEYEFNQIGGSANTQVTLGALFGKTKCIEAKMWIKSIWDCYYERKANGSIDTDYSHLGKCPHTVPELIVEIENT